MNAVVVTVVQVVAVILKNESMSPGLGARLQKPWKILLRSFMMKNATRSTPAIDMAWFMFGLTDVLLALLLPRVFLLLFSMVELIVLSCSKNFQEL